MKLHWVKPQGLCKRSVALGTFDGVHLGHRQLLSLAVNQRPAFGCSTVFTFDYPPEQVFTGSIRLLTEFSMRQQLLFEQGIDEVVWTAFDKDLAKEPPEKFVRHILMRALRVEHVVCGFNFRFGHQAQGTPDLLREFGQRHGFSVDVVEPFIVTGKPVSSTRIRQLLLAGRVQEAAQLLGRYHSYKGAITTGAGRGRQLGFPTANVSVPPELVLPQDAVYATWSILPNGQGHPSVTAVSTNPTFDGKKRTVESYLLDFSGDLYGQTMELQFLAKLRDIVRYDNGEALKQQIQEDVDRARAQIAPMRLQLGRVVLE